MNSRFGFMASFVYIIVFLNGFSYRVFCEEMEYYLLLDCLGDVNVVLSEKEKRVM